MKRQRTLRAAVVAVSVVALLSGCGGGDDPSGTPAPPAANIDRGADGAVGGPVNQARAVADAAAQRERQLEDQAGG